MALLCHITNQQKGYPFEVVIPAGLPIRGVILADQIKSLDWLTRKAEAIGVLPAATITEVLQKVATRLTLIAP